MALQVWLPLISDLRQQGLADTSTITLASGNAFVNGGKIGNKALHLTKQQTILGTSSCMSGKKQMSYAFWVKVNTAWSTQWLDGIAWYSTDGSSSAYYSRQEFYKNCTRIGTWFSGHSLSDYVFTPGEWTHIAGTFDYTTGIAKFYINGVLQGTSTYLSKTHYCRGDFYLGDSGVDIVENDVRIYDHCLSPMEVKELAKGLVLHYPLNRQGWGQENLLSGNNAKITTWTNYMPDSVILSGDGYDNKYTLIKGIGGWEKIFTDAITVTSGKTYTLSFDYSVEQNYTGYSGQFGLSVCTTSQAKNGADTDVITKVNFGTVQKSKSRTSVTFTATSNTIYLVANGGNINDGQENISFYISYLKLEKGSIATPWCPNSADALATTMGLNSTTEYDCSGFCNNGTRTGTFTWTSNTPKYAVSQVFNGTDNAIQTPSLPTMITDKNYTIAVWIYKTAIGSKNYQTIYGGPSGFELEARNATTTEAKFVGWNWGKPAAAYEFNKWNHCVFVHSDDDCKVYLNGEYVATGTAKASNPSGNYFVGAWNTATQQNFEGLMSDFRIYATALSASDVKSLYQNSAYIDSSGNVYGAVHSEV